MLEEKFGKGTIAKTWRRNKDNHLIHDDDCQFWKCCVCTCGLLHHLRPVTSDVLKLVPDFYKQDGAECIVVGGLLDSKLVATARAVLTQPDRPLTAEQRKKLEAILCAVGINTSEEGR